MLIRNAPILGAYNDLQYANYQPVVQQRPIQELAKLYETRQKDYNYVVDTSNKLDVAITNTPHLEEDRDFVLEAKNQVNKAFQEYGEQGDFENRVFDVNRLVSDISKKLQPIQQRKKQFDSYVTGLSAKDKDGNLKYSMDDIKKGIYLTKKNIKENPLVFDEDLGTYIGGFSGVNVPSKINFSDRIAKVLDDWKSNKITLTDNQGNLLERIPGTGKLRAGTKEYTDDAELIQAAKSYLLNDSDFIDKYKFDLNYEITKLQEEDGREIDLDDIRSIVSGDLKSVSRDLGLDPNRSLEQQIKEGDISSDQLYRRIRLEQMTNSAIKLGVSKESYSKYEDKFLRDDLLLKALDWQNKNRENGQKPIDSDAHVAIHKIATDNVISPSNYNAILGSKQASEESLKQNQATLNRLRQEDTGTPQQIDLLNNAIQKDSNTLEEVDRQLKSIREFVENKSDFNFTPYYEAYINKIDEDREEFVGKGGTEANSIKEIPKMSFIQYKDQVINKFINKDYFSVAEDFITGIGPENHRLDVAAEALRDSYGGDIESGDYTQDYHTFLIEGTSKDSQLYNNYVKAKKEAFVLNPNTFTNNNKNFETILEEEYDLELDEVDLTKSDIFYTVEDINKKPGFIIDVAVKGDKGSVSKGNVRIKANYEGGLLDESHVVREISEGEAYRRFKDKDLNNLNLQDKAMLRKLALSWIDNSPIGNSFDELNLYVRQPGIPVKFSSNGLEFNIVPQKDGLAAQEGYDKLVYNLTNPNGETQLIRTMEDGTKVAMWGHLKAGDIPVDYNSPSEIKEVLASNLLSDRINKRRIITKTNPYADQLNLSPVNSDLQDVTPIFKQNVQQGITPYMNTKYTDSLKSLVSDFPNIFISGSSKDGDSFTTRINRESVNLFKTSKSILDSKYGIESIVPVNEDKGEVRNFADADYFQVRFK